MKVKSKVTEHITMILGICYIYGLPFSLVLIQQNLLDYYL